VTWNEQVTLIQEMIWMAVTVIYLIYVLSCVVSRFVYIVFTVDQGRLLDVSRYVIP
jgi:hypothetical protein